MVFKSFFDLQVKRLFRAPNYVKSFGLVHGLRLLFQIEKSLKRKTDKMRRFSAPGYDRPIWLRDTVSDHSIFWQCIVTKQYDINNFPQVQKLNKAYDRLLNEGKTPVIIDAGGNIGLASVWFHRQYPQSAIIPVEPEENNFELLKKNVEGMGDQVTPVLGGVTNERVEMRIVNTNAGSSAFELEKFNGGSTGRADAANGIQGYSIENLISEVKDPALFIVKIDIEGGQNDLFSTNTEWVSKADLIILELDDWQFPWRATSTNFFRSLSQHRFDYLISGESIFAFRHENAPR